MTSRIQRVDGAPVVRGLTWLPVVTGAGLVAVLSAMRNVPMLPALLVAAVLVVWALAPRIGWVAAGVAVAVCAPLGLYLASTIAAATAISVRACVAAVCVAAIAAACVRRGQSVTPGVDAFRLTAVGAVPALWVLVSGVGAVIHRGWARDWALSGDSANNVLFARDVLAYGGTPWHGENPVPLPHVLIAMDMAGGEIPAPGNDLTAYLVTWHLLILMCLILAGLMGNVAVRRSGVRGRLLEAMATVLPPVFVSSWAVTGHALGFGFINSHVGLALCLLSLLAALLPMRAAWGLAMQVGVALLLIGTWTPLAALPAVMGMVQALRVLRERPSRRTLAWLALLISGSLLLVADRVLTFRSSAGSAFASAGGVMAPSARTLAVTLVVLVAVALVAVARGASSVGRWALVSAGGLGLGVAVTSVLARGQWAYYPMKMSWFAGVIAITVLATLAIPLVAHVRPSRAIPVAAGAVVFGVVATVVPAVIHETTGRPGWLVDPWSRVVGVGSADDLASLIEQSQHEAPGVVLLWGTGSAAEETHNFWIVNLASGAFDPSAEAEPRLAARTLAYAMLNPGVAQLCEAESRLPERVTVVTGDPQLRGAVDQACGADAPSVVDLADVSEAMRDRVQSTQ